MGKMKKPGDVIELGDHVGHPMEPYRRWARVVAIRKDDCKQKHRVILRRFKEGDTTFPTGDYVTTALVVPYMPDPQEY